MVTVKIAMNIADPAFLHSSRQDTVVPLNKFRPEILEHSEGFNINTLPQKRFKVCQIFISIASSPLRHSGRGR